MKESLAEKFERIFSAVTFAESGEFETAREILNESPSTKLGEALSSDTTIDDLISTAITFAEEGEHEKALEIMKEADGKIKEIKTTLASTGAAK